MASWDRLTTGLICGFVFGSAVTITAAAVELRPLAVFGWVSALLAGNLVLFSTMSLLAPHLETSAAQRMVARFNDVADRLSAQVERSRTKLLVRRPLAGFLIAWSFAALVCDQLIDWQSWDRANAVPEWLFFVGLAVGAVILFAVDSWQQARTQLLIFTLALGLAALGSWMIGTQFAPFGYSTVVIALIVLIALARHRSRVKKRSSEPSDPASV